MLKVAPKRKAITAAADSRRLQLTSLASAAARPPNIPLLPMHCTNALSARWEKGDHNHSCEQRGIVFTKMKADSTCAAHDPFIGALSKFETSARVSTFCEPRRMTTTTIAAFRHTGVVDEFVVSSRRFLSRAPSAVSRRTTFNRLAADVKISFRYEAT